MIQESEDRSQKTGVRRQESEDRSQKTEVRRQKTEDRIQAVRSRASAFIFQWVSHKLSLLTPDS